MSVGREDRVWDVSYSASVETLEAAAEKEMMRKRCLGIEEARIYIVED